MQSISIALEDKTIRGIRHQSGTEPVIAIHGWQDNCHSFLPMMQHLENGLDWLAVDLPGHGHSDWRGPDAHYYFVDYVDDLLQIMDAQRIERCHLVGHSMGAMIISLFAACFPDRVKSLTLIDGIGIITTAEDETAQQLKRAIVQRTRDRGRAARVYPDIATLTAVRAAAGNLAEPEAHLLMTRNALTTAEGVSNRCDPRLKFPSGFRFSPMQAKGALKNLAAPSLLIRGDRGLAMLEMQLADYGHLYPQLKVETVPGGHHCHMENPAQAAALAAQFIAKE